METAPIQPQNRIKLIHEKIYFIKIAILLSAYCNTASSSDQTFPPDHGPNLCEPEDLVNYDFIVCGAGSAGSTLASRLSENPNFNVLLLERGNDPGENTELPFKWASLLKSDIDYQYVSEPADHLFKGLHSQVSSIPRGKVSGGCSSINVCMYIRGNCRDFDDWAQRGCTGWDYQSVMPYFLKAEDYCGQKNTSDKLHHSTGGPLTVSPFSAPDPAVGIFSSGFEEMGVKELADLNGPSSLGYGISDSTTRNGRRCSSFKAYIPLTTSRSNFYFARNVLVRRVIFDEWRTAIGVEVTSPSGKICILKAKREIILSLGAIGTPQVLMLSGIGPKEALEKVGIQQLVDSPVGRNYQDHLCFVGTVLTDRTGRLLEHITAESSKLIQDTFQLIKNGVSTMGLTELVAFIDTTNKNIYPDIELMLMRISHGTMMQTYNGKHKLYNMFGMSDETADLFTKLNDQTDLIFVILILLEFKSNGYIELKSADPIEYPKIYPHFLSHQEDIDTMLRAIKFVKQLSETESLKNYGLRLEHVDYKGCTHTKPFSDEYWTCALEQIATGFYHPGCSAKMGGAEDDTAVLTPRLQVKGVHGLRVVDASAMLRMVSANPNAAVIMMAEKLADMLKEDHEYSLFNAFRTLLMVMLRQSGKGFYPPTSKKEKIKT